MGNKRSLILYYLAMVALNMGVGMSIYRDLYFRYHLRSQYLAILTTGLIWLGLALLLCRIRDGKLYTQKEVDELLRKEKFINHLGTKEP